MQILGPHQHPASFSHVWKRKTKVQRVCHARVMRVSVYGSYIKNLGNSQHTHTRASAHTSLSRVLSWTLVNKGLSLTVNAPLIHPFLPHVTCSLGPLHCHLFVCRTHLELHIYTCYVYIRTCTAHTHRLSSQQHHAHTHEHTRTHHVQTHINTPPPSTHILAYIVDDRTYCT